MNKEEAMSDEDLSGFHWLDYVLFSASLAFSLGVGIYHGYCGEGQRSTKQYLLGNKKMKAFPVAMSLLMSSISGKCLTYRSNYITVECVSQGELVL